MSLPIGLIPVLIFVVTIGISVPVALTVHLLYRAEEVPPGSGLRAALLEAGLLYLVGVGIIWSIAGAGLGGSLWGIPAALIVVGIGTLLGLVALPLTVGQYVISYFGNVGSERASRYAIYGWPVAMLAVFGIFVAPGGLTRGHLFHLEGAQICLGGFCGIPIWFAAAVFVEAFIAVFGPGLVGLLLASQRRAGHRFLPIQ